MPRPSGGYLLGENQSERLKLCSVCRGSEAVTYDHVMRRHYCDDCLGGFADQKRDEMRDRAAEERHDESKDQV